MPNIFKEAGIRAALGTLDNPGFLARVAACSNQKKFMVGNEFFFGKIKRIRVRSV